jgi:hypothetical protein
MGLKTGQTNNPNGRPKGVPNKVTSDLREWINKFLDGKKKQIQKDWKALEPKDRVALFEKLLKYCIPTMQATSLTHEFEKMSDAELEEALAKLKEKVLSADEKQNNKIS